MNIMSQGNMGKVKFILSFFLMISMLAAVGCDGKKDDTDSKSKPVANSSSENISTEPVAGEFSYEETVISAEKTVKEYNPKGNTANLSNPIKGYKDAAAESLRKEIINTENTEKYYKITGQRYYVSSLNGDDSNDGTSPDKPFKSIEALRDLKFKPGDAVLFQRGSLFRIGTTFLASKGVIYGSYGSGEKPKIYGSPMNLVNLEWTPSVKKNVWQFDYTYSECASMIFNHGEAIGYKKTSLKLLKKNTDFYLDPSSLTMYVYCDEGNPARIYKSIDVATRLSIINIPSGVTDVTIDNLCLKYAGMFGVSGTWDTSNINITNCEIGYMGGATHDDGTTRYGNAVQFWTGAENIKCDHNWIYQTFDTAVTWQGYGAEKFRYENILFSNNLLEYNNGDFEFWDDKSTVKNFNIKGNILRFTSLGWGTRADDGGWRGIDGCFVGDIEEMNVSNLKIQNNIIDSPGRVIMSLRISNKDFNKNVLFSGLEVYVNSSLRTSNEVIRGLPSGNDFISVIAKDKVTFAEGLKKYDSKAVLEWK